VKILSIEYEITKNIDFEDVIEEVALKSLGKLSFKPSPYYKNPIYIICKYNLMCIIR